MGRRILAIIVAAVLALIGGVMVLLYARNADQRAVSAASPKTVYTSSLLIPAGTSIRDAVRLQMLTETQIPANGVPAGALTEVTEENASLLALTDIQQGQYVLAASFGDTPVGQKLIQVPTGKLAVSVALSDPARVGSFVTPGSFLTVFATHPAAPKGKAETDAGMVTSVLLDNIQVIGIGGTPLQSGVVTAAPTDEEAAAATEQAQGASFLVTLAVTPEQATKLVHAVNQYTLYSALRGSEVKVNPKLETTDQNVFGG
ncbi:MAG TPA: RcpC/CpaB family pilus assembly protein [Ornithinibacter sp.]|nr:RcpC/CpaB family pilus assembly protein [Ornithinibacter sp.]